MTAVAEYRRLVAELAGTARRRDADLTAAEWSYIDGSDSVATELEALARLTRAASRRAETAVATVTEVDWEAARLWGELRSMLGWRGRRLGTVPPPVPTVEPDPAALLRCAAERLAQAKRGRPRKPLPRRVLPLLPALGAAAAALVACVAAGLLVLGLAVTTVLGQVVFFLAPFTGLPVASAWMDRRYGARLDTGGIGLTVIGGMVGCSVVMLALR